MILKKFTQYFKLLESITDKDHSFAESIELQMFFEEHLSINIELMIDQAFKEPKFSPKKSKYSNIVQEGQNIMYGFIHLLKHNIITSKQLGKLIFDPFDIVYDKLHIQLKKIFNKTLRIYFKTKEWEDLKMYLSTTYEKFDDDLTYTVRNNTNIETWVYQITLFPFSILYHKNLEKNNSELINYHYDHLKNFTEYFFEEPITEVILNRIINIHYYNQVHKES